MTPERTPEGPLEGMGMIVKTVARWLKGFVLLYGIYIVLYGHLTPGGGFAGGLVIACSFILLTLAGGEGHGQSFFTKGWASTLDGVGLLLFLALAWLGTLWAEGAFFENFIATPEARHFTLISGGIIPAANIALGLKVASSIFLVFTVLAAMRLVPRDGSDGEGETS